MQSILLLTAAKSRVKINSMYTIDEDPFAGITKPRFCTAMQRDDYGRSLRELRGEALAWFSFTQK